jgi:hypothetical protein
VRASRERGSGRSDLVGSQASSVSRESLGGRRPAARRSPGPRGGRTSRGKRRRSSVVFGSSRSRGRPRGREPPGNRPDKSRGRNPHLRILKCHFRFLRLRTRAEMTPRPGSHELGSQATRGRDVARLPQQLGPCGGAVIARGALSPRVSHARPRSGPQPSRARPRRSARRSAQDAAREAPIERGDLLQSLRLWTRSRGATRSPPDDVGPAASPAIAAPSPVPRRSRAVPARRFCIERHQTASRAASPHACGTA